MTTDTTGKSLTLNSFWWITSDGSTFLSTSSHESTMSSSSTQLIYPSGTGSMQSPPSSSSSPSSPSSSSLLLTSTLNTVVNPSATQRLSTVITSVPVTVKSSSTMFTSFSEITSTVTNTLVSAGTSLPDSGSALAGTQPVCIGSGLDVSAVGIIATVILPSVIGILLWLLFALLRPHFRQVYAAREWFAPQGHRPRPLPSTLWAFLFPYVPLIPSLPTGTGDSDDPAASDPDAYPSDGQLSQRVLWTSFLIAAGWSIVGLVGALPLYLVTTPCLAQSASPSAFTGVYSTLQDLSLLRLLQLLENGNVQTTGSLQTREVVNGKDVSSNVRIRLIVLTVFVLVLAMLPALHRILREFNRFANYRQRWLDVRCQGIEMGWLSATKAPGFVGWGEKRLKDFIVKTGLGTLDRNGGNGNGNGNGNMAGIGSGYHGTNRNRSQEEEYPMNVEEKGKPEIDVQALFSIGDTHLLSLLIDERDEILNNLEIAETRYISSFRLSTPEPSLVELPIPPEDENDIKRHISRPRALAGSNYHRAPRSRKRVPNAPTSYVAPSQYYKLQHVHGISGGRMASESGEESPSFGDTVRQRVVGTRFQEMNRDSLAYGRLPIGSRVEVDTVGELGPLAPIPDPHIYGPNHGVDPSSSNDADGEMSPVTDSVNPGTSQGPSGEASRDSNVPGFSERLFESPINFEHMPVPTHTPSAVEYDEMGAQRRVRRTETPPAERRETFAMRRNGDSDQQDSHLPPHLRLQPQQPFVRPVSGLDHSDLGAVYSDIREWRSKLKNINAEIADSQNESYNDIADGVRIKGWLITGRGVRFLPGIQMIEGRSKADIRWDQLQQEGGILHKISFWTITAMIAILLGAALIAVAGLALATAPDVAHFLPFLQPLLSSNHLASGLATSLTPAVAGTLFIFIALAIVNYAVQFEGSVAVSALQLTAFKATFLILTLMAAIWLVAVGAVIFAMDAFSTSSSRPQSVANGSIYMSAFLLALVLNAAVISPALLLLQPRRVWRVLRRERRAITPRQRFRAVYPRTYNPSYATGCCVLALVFASTFSLIFPLIGPAVVILLLLTLVAHRFLIGYVYGRTDAQTGGLTQLWLLRRFGTIVTFQPVLLGLIFMTRRLWVEGGILLGVGLFVIFVVEGYTNWKTRVPGVKSLSRITRNSLETFDRTARPVKRRAVDEEGTSLVSSQRVRPRGSMASVLEMMSLTLAVMPSTHQTRGPVPLDTETLDDLTATERAARTHPDAAPHLPPLPFADHAEEMSGILYAPELIAPPPIIWLPNDAAGIARSEAYDLQRYHSLQTTLDVRSTSDVLPRRSSSSRAR